MATRVNQADLDITEQLQRIRQLSADADARYQEAIKAERDRGLGFMIHAMTAGAALMGAAFALASLFFSR